MRFQRLLANTAIALVLTAGVAAHAGLAGKTDKDGVPQIESASLVITPSDIDRPASPVPAPVEDLTPAAIEPGESPAAEPGRDAAEPSRQPIEDIVIPLPEPAELVITPDDLGIELRLPKRKAIGTETPAADLKREAIPRIEPVELDLAPAELGLTPAETAAQPAADTATEPAAVTEQPTGPATAAAVDDAPAETELDAIPSLEPATVVITPDDLATTPRTDPDATGSLPAMPAPEEVALDPLGEKLRDALAEGSGSRLFDSKTREALNSFYGARDYAPVWTKDGAVSEQATSVIAQLGTAAADGLNPADYRVPTLEAQAGPEALAAFELKLTDTVMDYARHAAVGRVHWSRGGRDVSYDLKPPKPADLLAKLNEATDAGAVLAGYFPQHQHYKALKDKLADIRGEKENAPVRIGSGRVMRVGMQDERVPDLRERLGLTGAPDDKTYDEALADAVKAFQKQHGLVQDGLTGPATIRALNGGPRNERTVDIILANLERWRWVSRDLGEAHVLTNVPEYMLRVYDKGSLKWETRIVAGKVSKATPLMSETMKFITVNPTWNVPPSIVYGEYLPALRQDPTVLRRMGLRVSYKRNGRVHIWQPPGPKNALGRIRFNFPNKFLVYQHDTPDKHMFKHKRRAYSHGCMRVQYPDKYAEVLLSIALPEKNYTASGIRKMYGRGEVNIRFPEPIPVHLIYQTATVDENGDLKLFADVYGRDRRVIAALKGGNRLMADRPVTHRRASSPRRSQSHRRAYRQQYRPNFFGLFR